MLLGLVALPALAAVYWLRSRSRSVVVSSLAFWSDQRRPRQGGRILERMQTPLTFFLEALILALLATAAAGPARIDREVARPLVVVLDDSYSMRAKLEGDARASVRDAAQAAVAEELRRGNYAARFLLAGAAPRFVGQSLYGVGDADEAFAQWSCESPWADLSRAIALAAEVGGPQSRILVVSDRAPVGPPAGGQVEWWAFGRKLPNVAFTAATRSATAQGERVLLEVANLSDSPVSTTLTVEGGESASPTASTVALKAGAARQFFFNLPTDATTLSARLQDDALEIDNAVVLLPASTRPLRVALPLRDARLRAPIVRALNAAGQAVVVDQRPDLVIDDDPGAMEGEAWRLEILAGKAAAAYTGPFVIDRGHELAQGLSLDSAIWSASPEAKISGLPVITAGNVTLLADREDASGRHLLQMNFAADASNIQDMPDWPILLANLLQWRRTALPGVAEANVRLGQTVPVRLDRAVKEVAVAIPHLPAINIEPRGRRVDVPADHVGLHAVELPDAAYQFSVNAVSRDESDLAACCAGRWGEWNESQVHCDRTVSIGWILLLAAIVVLAAHQAVIAARRKGVGT
jgi:hypothetical protein